MSVIQDKARRTWTAKVNYIDPLGQRKYKTKRGFKTKREAKEYEAEFLAKIRGATDMTVRSLVEVYLEDCRLRLKPSTLISKEPIINRWVIPYMGNKSLVDLTPAYIRKWQNWLGSQDLSSGYLRNVNSALTVMLDYAVKFLGLRSNPAKAAGTVGTNPESKASYWTPEEFERFYSVAKRNPEDKVLFPLLYYTGIRIGEALALTLDDFDREAGTMTISKTLTHYKREDYITSPKTRKSRRTIQINHHLFDLVEELASILPYYEPSERLFLKGRQTYSSHLRKATDEAGVPQIRLHDFRHSHASLLIELGVPMLAIRDRLGHESVQTTLDTYSHLYREREREVIEKLSGVIEGPQ